MTEIPIENQELRVTALVPGGDGFGKAADGRAAFVPGAFPGDLVRVDALVRSKSWVRATRWTLLEASPERRASVPCAVADRCGGCDWMALDPEAQLRAKALLLRDAWQRVGKLAPVPIRVERVGADLAYRQRLRLHVDADGRLGLHARSTRDVVEIARCPVAVDELQPVLAELRALGREHPGALSAFSSVELRSSPAADQPVLVIFSPRGTPSPAARALVRAAGERWRVSSGADGADEPALNMPLAGGLHLIAPASAFTQVNWPVNLALIEGVLAAATEAGAETFCDLYSGAGNFTLPLLSAGLRGKAIEGTASAARAARRAAVAAGLSADGIEHGDVRARLRRLVSRGERFDLLVIDPPRSGAKAVMADVAKLAAPDVCYVSCDPVTLARDAAVLVAAGYRVSEIRGFDMFPQTHHVEALARFRL